MESEIQKVDWKKHKECVDLLYPRGWTVCNAADNESLFT
jgi:hypothetical protein